MKTQKEEILVNIKFDKYGMPKLPDDDKYPEWGICD